MQSIETFPLAVEPQAILAPAAPILIADDDPDDLFFAARLIRKTGTQQPVITFNDGEGVVDYLSRAWLGGPGGAAALPRLLFLDLKMSGLGGFAFLSWVREHRARAPFTVIVLSGSNEPEDVERAKKLGAKRYLAKFPSLATFSTIVRDIHAEARPAMDSGWQEEAPFYSAAIASRERFPAD